MPPRLLANLRLIVRWLTILAFALWVGGFTLYVGFVIRKAHQVHEIVFDIGQVTQHTMGALNVVGVVALLLFAVNIILHARGQPRAVLVALTALVLLMAAMLVGLFITLAEMNALLDAPNRLIIDPPRFELLHDRYERLATIQWFAAVAYVPVTLLAWRRCDRAA